MENKYLDILNSLGKEDRKQRDDRILIIDGLNSLIRSFSAVKTINPKGYHVGGLTGFLKSLGYTIRQFNPTRVIIAWDGKGGAQNRKNLNSNYKAQRKHSSVIHWDIYDSKEDEMESLHDQADRLRDYLDCLPVTFVQIDKLEADDIIAYMAQSASQRGTRVTIVSMDRDFLQLVDDNVEVYNPLNKNRATYNYERAVEYLGILPENYNIVKALQGDKSDNLQGVRGVGLKTLVKIFPKLATEVCTLQEIYDECAKNLGKKLIYANILNDWDRVELNFKLMDLHNTVLDEKEVQVLSEQVRKPVPKLNKPLFLMLLDQDCVEGFVKEPELWLDNFDYLQKS